MRTKTYEDEQDEQDQGSFLDERSVGSQSESGVEEPMDQDDNYERQRICQHCGSRDGGIFSRSWQYRGASMTTRKMRRLWMLSMQTPSAIMRARMSSLKNAGTPSKVKFAPEDNWINTLKTTISPQKQDRALLKSLIELQGNESRAEAEPTLVARRVSSDGRGFATNIDLMNSLFGQTRSPVKAAKVPAKSKGFEVGFSSHD
jgi:nuclear pore complex protein Nup98-Nup96